MENNRLDYSNLKVKEEINRIVFKKGFYIPSLHEEKLRKRLGLKI